MRFINLLNETYLNFVGYSPDAINLKKKYVDDVWNILQTSYAHIGGIHGNGFKNKEDMINNIPFWKLSTNNGKVNAVIMYKDSNGRKSVAMGTDKSDISKDKIKHMVSKDFERAYGEKSGSALGLLLKTIPRDVLEPFIKTPIEVQQILKKDKIISLKDYKGIIPDDVTKTLIKYPYLTKYGYFRDIGGSPHFKVMIGTIGKNIIPN